MNNISLSFICVFFCSKSKWYLSKEDFPSDKFPPYCSGSGTIKK
jgi:hypothetical protein